MTFWPRFVEWLRKEVERPPSEPPWPADWRTPAPQPQRVIMQGDYEVHEVILHTTATGADWWKGKTAEQMVAEVRKWHKAQGWRDIGYHGLIAPDGSYAQGRPFTQQGAHVKERNRGTIGLVLVPVADVDPHRVKRFEDYYTAAQKDALKRKIAAIGAMTRLDRVAGHNSYTTAKTCPGFYVDSADWMP